jgi:type IV secretory pathway VirJ component
MKRLLLPLLLAGLAATSTVAGAGTTTQLEHGRFGAVRLLAPDGRPTGMVLWLSNGTPATAATATLPLALQGQGIVVAELDTPHYLRSLRDRKKGCNYLAADLEDLAHRIGREAGLDDYHVPSLVGEGEGAVLAQIALLQAPAGTFAGAVAIHPADHVNVGPAALCAGPRGALTRGSSGNGDYRMATMSQGGDGYLREDHAPLPAILRQASAARPAALASAPQGVGDLPLVLLPVETPTRRLALMISGDGGWAGIDKEVAAQLAGRGIPVVGVSSLQYFWKRRTPAATAADMTRVLRHYLDSWHATQIVLVGYSFGADVLPFIINRLPPDLRERIVSVNLLALGTGADFEIHVAGWLGGSGDAALPLAPELAGIVDLPQLCFYGAGDTASQASCTSLRGQRTQLRRIGEGHHFGYLYSEIADEIVAFADHR